MNLSLEQIIGAVILMLLLEGAKRVQGLNIWKGEKKKIRMVAGGLSIVSAVLIAGLNGNLADPEFLQLGANALTQFLMVHFGYEGIKNIR